MMSHTKTYLKFARELQDTVMQQRALASLGRTYMFMEEAEKQLLQEARTHLEESLAAVGKIPSFLLDRRGEMEAMWGRAYHNPAQVSHQLGDSDGFKEHLERAEQVLSSDKLTDDLFNLFDGVTNLLLQTGDKEGLEIAVDSGNKCLEWGGK